MLILRRTHIALICFLALMHTVALIPPVRATPGDLTSLSEEDSELDSVVVTKLAFYADAFPEILFVALPSGDGWLTSFATFLALLGDRAQNLDYEHPAKLREDLLYVTKARLQAMLRAGESSSSLYRVAADGLAAREYMCAIIIDPPGIASDDEVATRHLLGIFQEDATRYAVPKNQRLDRRHHLEYVLDHEIFHCLDALYNRPIPMSNDERTTAYFHFLNENGADAFALAMHVKRYEKSSKYSGRLAHIRGLSLFWGDPGHFTYDSARRILERENDDLMQMSASDILALAASVRDRVAPTFSEFLEYESAAREAGRSKMDSSRSAGICASRGTMPVCRSETDCC